MEQDIVFLNALNRISFLGPVRIESLLRHCRTARASWQASPGTLAIIPEMQGLEERFCRERELIDPGREWFRLQELRIHCLSLADAAYPDLLRQISRPPPLLYYRGVWQESDRLAVAIVGSRRCTYYGKEVAHRLAGELAAAGITVISGLALGVDTAAHQGALEMNGRTIAVLGCGPERCYPPANASLMSQVAAAGVVVSEFPLDTVPLPQHFPQRNRIISGLSLGTVVVEATAKSGALITAHYALDQNREVFAVPGNVGSPYSRGCHRLLREGARLVETAVDILEELAVGPVPVYSETAAAGDRESNLAADEKRILELVPYRPLHVDEIIRLSDENAARIGSLLLNLELKGLLRQLPGKYFSRI